MRTIGVVTTSRSDYTNLRPVLRALDAHDDVRPRVYAAGTHLSRRNGRTIEEIEADGFEIAARLDTAPPDETPESQAVAMGATTTAYAHAFTYDAPDLVVVIGDRFDMHAAALAAVPLRIPIAHIHGGDLTEDPVADALRHSITKLSHLHFPATAEAARRIRQLGEEDWRVHRTGAPSLDALRETELLPRHRDGRYVLVTYRTPDHRDEESPDALLEALDDLDAGVVFVQPGGADGLDRLARFAAGHPGSELIVDPTRQELFSLMAHASAMVGNSTTGIVVAASFELPVVDVGVRQRGRARGENVLTAIDDPTAIALALDEALDPAFRDTLSGMENPYGDGRAAPRIAATLASVELDERLLRKRFKDR